jgi:hypothetical protein
MSAPIERPATFVVDFVLREADLESASEAAHPWMASFAGRLASRVICGVGAILFLSLPGRNAFKDVPDGWGGMWSAHPIGTVFFVTFCILGLWVAAGLPGLRTFELRVNHVGGRRCYTFTDQQISTTNGKVHRIRAWESIFCFRETEVAFLLQTKFLSGHYIPKSALGASNIEAFRNFLLSKRIPSAEMANPWRSPVNRKVK